MADKSVAVYNASGSHQVVLVCEHASACIPDKYQRLGLDADIAKGHIAWDPGALDTAVRLSGLLDAVLVSGTVSRLVYDLNRPPDSPGAMIAHSEKYPIPGNTNLDADERRHRVALFYQPFVNTVADVLAGHRIPPVLVTIHSFTPVYQGVNRDVEIGVLHDSDSRLADAMLAGEHRYNVQRNEPYGPQDGVTHTLKLHAIPSGRLNVMIEVRNDLIADEAACSSMAEYLAHWLQSALSSLESDIASGDAT